MMDSGSGHLSWEAFQLDRGINVGMYQLTGLPSQCKELVVLGLQKEMVRI
jgi:hypothetical protein